IAIEGTQYTLPARAFTMGELFKGRRRRHRNLRQVALRRCTARHGFDEFYGIPPDISWDAAPYVDTMELTLEHVAPGKLLARGPQIFEATAGSPLRTVKPFTPEVRANIDYELVDRSIDFTRRQKVAGKPFFLYCRSRWDTCQICLRSSSRESRGTGANKRARRQV